MSGESPKWQQISKRKREEQLARIPSAWRLKTQPTPDVTSYLDIPTKCGLLTQEELRITEQYDAVGLAEAIREKNLSCVDVTRAFCKVFLGSLPSHHY